MKKNNFLTHLKYSAISIGILFLFIFLAAGLQLMQCRNPEHQMLPLGKRIFTCFLFPYKECSLNFFWANWSYFLIFVIVLIGIGIFFKNRSLQIMQRSLEDAKIRLNQALDVVHEGVFEYYPDSDRIHLSESLFNMSGHPRPSGEISMEELLPRIHSGDRAYFLEQFHDSLKTGIDANFKVRIQHGEDTFFPVQVRCRVQLGTLQKSLIGTIRDISADVEAMQNLRQLRRRLESALKITGEGVFELSCPEMKIQCNISPNRSLAGVPLDQLVGHTILELVGEKKLQEIKDWSEKFKDIEEPGEFYLETMLPLNESMMIPARLTFRRILRNGNTVIIMNVRDLSSEQNDSISALLLQMASDNLPVGLIITRAEGQIFYFNAIAHTSLPDLKKNQFFWELLPAEDVNVEACRDFCLGGGTKKLTLHLNTREYELNRYSLKVATGFTCLLLLDRTESIENETRLNKALAAEQLAHQKRLNVMNAINYELRKPLTGILGFADLLQDETLSPEERHEYLQFIVNSGNQLQDLWTNVLELTTLECGLMDVEMEKTNINSILNQLQVTYRTKIPPHINFLIHKAQRDVDVNIISDESVLVHIFSKILDNSIQDQTPGTLEAGYIANRNSVSFYISDSRNLISEKERDFIFEPFESRAFVLENTLKVQRMNLAISKMMIELLGGKIQLEFPPAGGCRFCFEIPAEPAEKK